MLGHLGTVCVNRIGMSTISTFELFQMFPDAEAARVYMEGKRWPDGAVCPACDEAKRITTRKGGYYSQRDGGSMNGRHIPARLIVRMAKALEQASEVLGQIAMQPRNKYADEAMAAFSGVVAVAHELHAVVMAGDRETDSDNARLIAADPDLLEAISPTFKKFGDLTNDQQFAVTLMHPSWDLDHLRRFEYRITKKGDLSRKKGDHRPTVDWSREIDRILGTPVESSASTGPTATRDQPIRRTGIHPMHLGSNRD